ncbi:MAG: hypothetical protein CM15mV129_320 [uncultured marine virus]|nr:MAG: hypothetical protein CM15mV129_320 [uncultured marine virus]
MHKRLEKERGEGDVNPDYFFKEKFFLQIERVKNL